MEIELKYVYLDGSKMVELYLDGYPVGHYNKAFQILAVDLTPEFLDGFFPHPVTQHLYDRVVAVLRERFEHDSYWRVYYNGPFIPK